MTEVDESAQQVPSFPPSDDEWSIDLGQRLQRARVNAGMSQVQVAQELGCTTRSLTRWENGECDPGSRKLIRMAELFDVSLDWIAGRTTVDRLLVPGKAIINQSAIALLKSLVEQGRTVRDIPSELIRRPGIDVGYVIPHGFAIMGADAATAVDSHASYLFQQLKKA